MNTPKHSRKIFDPLTGKAEIITFNAWLGTGVLDKNGKEIFEGDKITANGYPYTIKYKSLIWYMIPDNPAMSDLMLCWHKNYDIEVVGHIAQD